MANRLITLDEFDVRARVAFQATLIHVIASKHGIKVEDISDEYVDLEEGKEIPDDLKEQIEKYFEIIKKWKEYDKHREIAYSHRETDEHEKYKKIADEYLKLVV